MSFKSRGTHSGAVLNDKLKSRGQDAGGRSRANFWVKNKIVDFTDFTPWYLKWSTYLLVEADKIDSDQLGNID